MATASYIKRQLSQASAADAGGASQIADLEKDVRGDKANRILKAALELFDRRHFADVTTKEIAASAGLNSALIYYYFENKDAVFRGVVEMAVNQVLEHFERLHRTSDGARGVITGWLETHILQFDLIRTFVKISIDYSSSGARLPETDAAIAYFYDTERSVLTSAVEAAIQGGVGGEVDADQIATFISTFLYGVMVRSILFSDFDYRSEIAHLDNFIVRQLGWAV